MSGRELGTLSGMATRAPSPQVGDPAPDFRLPDAVTGTEYRPAQFAGRDVLLVFFRGTWCPFCRQQMRVLKENHPRLERAGVQVLGVVCQSPASVRRYLAGAPLPFPLLVDERREAARAYGVHYRLSWDGVNLARPSLFVLDGEGRITFRYVGGNMRDLPVTSVLERFVRLLDGGETAAAAG